MHVPVPVSSKTLFFLCDVQTRFRELYMAIYRPSLGYSYRYSKRYSQAQLSTASMK